jgi:serine protease Do
MECEHKMQNKLLKPIENRQRVIAGAVGTALAVALLVQPIYPVAAKSAPAHTSIPSTSIADKPAGFADVVEAVKPAVVNISTTGASPTQHFKSGPRFRFPPESPFQEFFDRHFDVPDDFSKPAEQIHAVGSGFVIDPEGYVVTNHHVIKGAAEITVVTNEGKRYPAELKGHDAKTDLALLKIDADTPLPYVVFGDSGGARVGDWVVAIGNPFGLGGTATTGIISARGRDIRSGPLDDFLQIDAPINQGNSGGPLFATDGTVVGVNTAIFSPNGGNVGIGFAIPSSMAKSVIDQLIATGRVNRGWLGVQIQTVTEDIADTLGFDDRSGALVASVIDGSPAEKAGIKTGDVIRKFDGEAVKQMRELPKLVANVPADRKVEIEVWRAGEVRTLHVTIGATPEQGQTVAEAGAAPGLDKPKLGLSLAPLTPETRRQFRVPSATEGVVVTEVMPGSPAARKGFSQGDVIKMIGGKRVSSPIEVVNAVERAVKAEQSSVLILVERDGSNRFVAVRFA